MMMEVLKKIIYSANILKLLTTLLIMITQKRFTHFWNPQDQKNISYFLVQVSKVNRKDIKS